MAIQRATIAAFHRIVVSQFLAAFYVAHCQLNHLTSKSNSRTAGIIDEYRPIVDVNRAAWCEVDIVVDLQCQITRRRCHLLDLGSSDDMATVMATI